MMWVFKFMKLFILFHVTFGISLSFSKNETRHQTVSTNILDRYEVREKVDEISEKYKEIISHSTPLPVFRRPAFVRMSTRNYILQNPSVWDCKTCSSFSPNESSLTQKEESISTESFQEAVLNVPDVVTSTTDLNDSVKSKVDEISDVVVDSFEQIPSHVSEESKFPAKNDIIDVMKALDPDHGNAIENVKESVTFSVPVQNGPDEVESVNSIPITPKSSSPSVFIGCLIGFMIAVGLIGLLYMIIEYFKQKPFRYLKWLENKIQHLFEKKEYHDIIHCTNHHLPKVIQKIGGNEEGNPSIYHIKHILGKCYFFQNDMNTSLQFFNELLSSYYSYYGIEDIYLAELYEDRGITLLTNKQYHDSLSSLHTSLRIFLEESLSSQIDISPLQLLADSSSSSSESSLEYSTLHTHEENQENDEEEGSFLPPAVSNHKILKKENDNNDPQDDDSHPNHDTETVVNSSYIDHYHEQTASEQKFYPQDMLGVDRLVEPSHLKGKMNSNEGNTAHQHHEEEEVDEELTPTVKLHDSSNNHNSNNNQNNSPDHNSSYHYYRNRLDDEFSHQIDYSTALKELEELIESPVNRSSSFSPSSTLSSSSSSLWIPYYHDLFKGSNASIIRVCKEVGDCYKEMQHYDQSLIFYCNTYVLLMKSGFAEDSLERKEIYDLIAEVVKSLHEQRQQHDHLNEEEVDHLKLNFTNRVLNIGQELQHLLPASLERFQPAKLSYYDSYHIF
jgi:hypothetical protein